MSDRGTQSRSRSRSGQFQASRSASRDGGGGRDLRSRSRSGTRSRSRSAGSRRSRSGSNDRSKRRESRSPMSDRRRHQGDRGEPEPNKCLGVFGLSLYTTERELEKEFGRFGPLEKTQVVLDGHSGRSRGFAFVYFENIKDATEARSAMNGLDLDGRKIRVDYSITKRPHTPTPGMYMGRPTDARDGGRGRGRGRGGGYRGQSSRHYDDRGPPSRHYDDRGPPRYDDRDRYGGPPRHYDDRGPPPRHYEDRGYSGGSRHYDDRGYGDRRADRYGGRDGYGGGYGDRYVDDRYGGSSRRPRTPSPYYRDTRPRREYRSRSRSYERPRY